MTVRTSRRTRLARRSSSWPRRLGDRVDGRAREAGAEHGEVADERPLVGREAVEPGHQERGEGGGHLEVVERARRGEARAVGLHQPAVDERPHDLDGVERDALGLVDDVLGHVGGEVDQVVEEPQHRRAVEGVEADAGAVAALPPTWSALGQLGPSQGEHEDGVGRRPVEEAVEEVEQAGVGPLQVVDHHHHRVALGQALEEHPPAGEEVVACQVGVGGAEQLGDARLDEVAVIGAGDQLVQARAAAWPAPRPSGSCSPMPKRWRTIWARAQ